MKLVATLALCAVTTACTSLPLARDYALAGIAADVTSTQLALDRGCHEGNPIYFGKGTGQRASIVGINLLLAGAIWWYADNVDPEDEGVTIPLWLAGSVRWAAAGYNTSLKC